MPDAIVLTLQLTRHGKDVEVRAASPAGEAQAGAALPPPELYAPLAAEDA